MSRRTLHDEYFRRAKADGYAARSAYKLIQIQESKRLMKRGDRVLDLGCAPGAWLQVAARVVGTSGSVVGLDLKPVSVSAGPNVVALVGDAFEIEPSALTEPAGGAFDCVVSDMAPNTTGHGDSERSVELCRRVLELLPGLLKPTGSLAMKVFEGALYRDLLAETKATFASVKGFKPKASRDVSREMYVVASGFCPTR